MKIEELTEIVNQKLDEYMEIFYPQKIFKSMKYTVLLPGKRLRPIMCLESARLFGAEIQDALPAACAIEMLHAQTLIHDDLPCMDNDDYRRGKLTNHKVFGEAIAVLAGDALLTFAPQIILKHSQNLGAEKLVKLMDDGKISSAIAKKVLEEMFENPKKPSKIVEEKGWIQISDEGEIKKIVLEILENNPQSIADYKAGKDRALGYLVGQAMKATKGKANPQLLNKLFLEELNK